MVDNFLSIMSSISKIPIRPARPTEFYPVLHNPNTHIYIFIITLVSLIKSLHFLNIYLY